DDGDDDSPGPGPRPPPAAPRRRPTSPPGIGKPAIYARQAANLELLSAFRDIHSDPDPSSPGPYDVAVELAPALAEGYDPLGPESAASLCLVLEKLSDAAETCDADEAAGEDGECSRLVEWVAGGTWAAHGTGRAEVDGYAVGGCPRWHEGADGRPDMDRDGREGYRDLAADAMTDPRGWPRATAGEGGGDPLGPVRGGRGRTRPRGTVPLADRRGARRRRGQRARPGAGPGRHVADTPFRRPAGGRVVGPARGRDGGRGPVRVGPAPGPPRTGRPVRRLRRRGVDGAARGVDRSRGGSGGRAPRTTRAVRRGGRAGGGRGASGRGRRGRGPPRGPLGVPRHPPRRPPRGREVRGGRSAAPRRSAARDGLRGDGRRGEIHSFYSPAAGGTAACARGPARGRSGSSTAGDGGDWSVGGDSYDSYDGGPGGHGAGSAVRIPLVGRSAAPGRRLTNGARGIVADETNYDGGDDRHGVRHRVRLDGRVRLGLVRAADAPGLRPPTPRRGRRTRRGRRGDGFVSAFSLRRPRPGSSAEEGRRVLAGYLRGELGGRDPGLVRHVDDFVDYVFDGARPWSRTRDGGGGEGRGPLRGGLTIRIPGGDGDDFVEECRRALASRSDITYEEDCELEDVASRVASAAAGGGGGEERGRPPPRPGAAHDRARPDTREVRGLGRGTVRGPRGRRPRGRRRRGDGVRRRRERRRVSRPRLGGEQQAGEGRGRGRPRRSAEGPALHMREERVKRDTGEEGEGMIGESSGELLSVLAPRFLARASCLTPWGSPAPDGLSGCRIGRDLVSLHFPISLSGRSGLHSFASTVSHPLATEVEVRAL
ncbi:hypothetical protein THAOC_36491, partial [Thalassiosira oceanica]